MPDFAGICTCTKTGQILWHFACSLLLDLGTCSVPNTSAAEDRRERAVLTSRPADASLASQPAAQVGAAILLSLVTFTAAYAGNVGDHSCVGTARSFNCVDNWATSGDPYVRIVPGAVGEAEKAQMMERDQRWLARCRPLVQRDSYGVARYYYASPGCEFGIGSD